MNSKQYRPDIDGLRAIAVVAVLINHLSSSILPGGFIGVDIFFVISGFLITSQIHKELCESTFSINQFYKRRINRIAPALVLILGATWSAGVVLLSPADLVRLGNSSIFAMLGLSNIFFWREYGSYFAGNSIEAPLLHTWSLGVEEQFYIIWPALIIFLFKFGRRHMLGVMLALTIGAIFISQVGVNLAASASYYLLPTRFFELMIGGVLAFVTLRFSPSNLWQARVGIFLGFLLIVGSLALINKSSSFPGILALWPCLGAALILWAGSGNQPPSRILSSRPLVFIGLISYSLYLWHWPIIAYVNYLNITIGPLVGTAIAAVAVTLSWLSWRFVEIPMRRSGMSLPFTKVFLQRFALPMVALMSIGVAAAYTSGFPQRFASRVAELEQALESKPNVLRSGCHVPTALYSTLPNSKCRLGSDKSEIDGILIGDSFANHFTGMLDVIAKAENISIMDYTMDGCPPILGYKTEKEPSYREKCLKRNEIAYSHIRQKNYSRVVLAGNWPTDAKAGDQLIESMNEILKTGATLTLILGNEGIENASSCPVRGMMYKRKDDCKATPKGPPSYFNKIKTQYPGVQVIDPNQVICTSGKCSPMLGDTLIYRDDNHLNDIGSRLLGKAMLERETDFQLQ